jgi:hypothetical protein
VAALIAIAKLVFSNGKTECSISGGVATRNACGKMTCRFILTYDSPREPDASSLGSVLEHADLLTLGQLLPNKIVQNSDFFR